MRSTLKTYIKNSIWVYKGGQDSWAVPMNVLMVVSILVILFSFLMGWYPKIGSNELMVFSELVILFLFLMGWYPKIRSR